MRIEVLIPSRHRDIDRLHVFTAFIALSVPVIGLMAAEVEPLAGDTITGKQTIKTKSILFIFLSVLFVYKSFFVNNSVIKSSLSKSPSMYTKVITPFLLTRKGPGRSKR